MAQVYRAWDLTLGRKVAVKVLPTALASDPGYVARVRAEARRVAALLHPHIVPVYSFGERPMLYLVMPILSESLRQWLRREGRLGPAEAIAIVAEIASALAAAQPPPTSRGVRRDASTPSLAKHHNSACPSHGSAGSDGLELSSHKPAVRPVPLCLRLRPCQ